jgi:hypothetical protein
MTSTLSASSTTGVVAGLAGFRFEVVIYVLLLDVIVIHCVVRLVGLLTDMSLVTAVFRSGYRSGRPICMNSADTKSCAPSGSSVYTVQTVVPTPPLLLEKSGGQVNRTLRGPAEVESVR